VNSIKKGSGSVSEIAQGESTPNPTPSLERPKAKGGLRESKSHSTKQEDHVLLASTHAPEEDNEGAVLSSSLSGGRAPLDCTKGSEAHLEAARQVGPSEGQDALSVSGDGPFEWSPALRGKIRGFSSSSRTRFVFTLRNSRFRFAKKIRLSYPEEACLTGRTIKKHLSRFLTRLRLDYPGVLYLWWLEFEENGTPCFHILVSCESISREFAEPLWAHTVKSKSTCSWSPSTSVQDWSEVQDAATSLYGCSVRQMPVPTTLQDGIGRFWGCSRKLVHPTLQITMTKSMLRCLLTKIKACPLESGEPVYALESHGVLVRGARLSVQILKDYLSCLSCGLPDLSSRDDRRNKVIWPDLQEPIKVSSQKLHSESKHKTSCVSWLTSCLYRVLLANYDANRKLVDLRYDLVNKLAQKGYKEEGLVLERTSPRRPIHEPYLPQTSLAKEVYTSIAPLLEDLLLSLRRKGLHDWFIEVRPLLVAETLVTYEIKGEDLVRHEQPNEARFQLKPGFINWLTSSAGLYCYYRQLRELRKESPELDAVFQKDDPTGLVHTKTRSLFGCSELENPCLASHMSTQDIEASNHFSEVWIECLSSSTGHKFRWSIIEQAFSEVPALLAYVPNATPALFESYHTECHCSVDNELKSSKASSYMSVPPNALLRSWNDLFFLNGGMHWEVLLLGLGLHFLGYNFTRAGEELGPLAYYTYGYPRILRFYLSKSERESLPENARFRVGEVEFPQELVSYLDDIREGAVFTEETSDELVERSESTEETSDELMVWSESTEETSLPENEAASEDVLTKEASFAGAALTESEAASEDEPTDNEHKSVDVPSLSNADSRESELDTELTECNRPSNSTSQENDKFFDSKTRSTRLEPNSPDCTNQGHDTRPTSEGDPSDVSKMSAQDQSPENLELGVPDPREDNSASAKSATCEVDKNIFDLMLGVTDPKPEIVYEKTGTDFEDDDYFPGYDSDDD